MTDTAGATVREKVRGTFDLFLLFGRGIKPFEKEGTFKHAMRSLWFVALSMPLGYLSAYIHHPEGLADAPFKDVAIIITGFGILSFIVGIAISYLFAIVMGKKDRFWLWFQAGNWMTIPNLAVGLPVIAVAALDHYPRQDIDNILTLLLYYGVLVNGCLCFRALKIGWEMAGFFTCMSVFIAQQIWNIMFWMNGYTAP